MSHRKLNYNFGDTYGNGKTVKSLIPAPSQYKLIVCPICNERITKNQVAVHVHYRNHIKRKEATQEDRNNLLKSLGLWFGKV